MVKLPLISTGNYDFYVNWGDSGTVDHITTWNALTATHSYSVSGTYNISISGTLTGFRFANTGDRLKIINISQWGILNPGNVDKIFHGCASLTAISATDTLNTTGMTAMSFAFAGCSNLATVANMNLWDMSHIIDMDSMFDGDVKFNQNIADWNTAAVTNMPNMFRTASVFDQAIASWNVGAVTNMSGTFQSSGFNHPLNSWNVSHVTNMGGMFLGTSFNQNIASWNVSAVTSMSSMFISDTAFQQDIGSWPITALTQAINMFLGDTLTNANYNALLIGWAAQTVQSGVTLTAGSSHYNGASAIAARATLVTTDLWTITDGGTP